MARMPQRPGGKSGAAGNRAAAPVLFHEGNMRVRLLIPFGIHMKGDVINVSTSVAEYWIERRMVEPAEDKPSIRSASIEPKAERAVVIRRPSK